MVTCVASKFTPVNTACCVRLFHEQTDKTVDRELAHTPEFIMFYFLNELNSDIWGQFEEFVK